jgi:hypothetical protein
VFVAGKKGQLKCLTAKGPKTKGKTQDGKQNFISKIAFLLFAL